MLAHIQKGISPLDMIAEAFTLLLIATVLSWHLIEKPSMSGHPAEVVSGRVERLLAQEGPSK